MAGRIKAKVVKTKTNPINLHPSFNIKSGYLEMDYVKELSFMDHHKASQKVNTLIAGDRSTEADVEFLDNIIENHFEIFFNEDEVVKQNKRLANIPIEDGDTPPAMVTTDDEIKLNHKIHLLSEFFFAVENVKASNKKK